MKKDFLLVYTKGVDTYNMNKQLRNFTESDIFMLDQEASYYSLVTMAEEAEKRGYDSFHYISMDEDWQDLDFEFKKEFTMFKETGVIPAQFGYNRLREADAATTNQLPQGLIALPFDYIQYNGDSISDKTKNAFAEIINFWKGCDPNTSKIYIPHQGKTGQIGPLPGDESYYALMDILKNSQSYGTGEYSAEMLNILDESHILHSSNTTHEAEINKLKANPNIKKLLLPGDVQQGQNGSHISYQPLGESNATDVSMAVKKVMDDNTVDQKVKDNKTINQYCKTAEDRYLAGTINNIMYNITNNITNIQGVSIQIYNNCNINNGFQAIGNVINKIDGGAAKDQALQGTFFGAARQANKYAAKAMFDPETQKRMAKTGADAASAIGAKNAAAYFGAKGTDIDINTQNKQNEIDAKVKYDKAVKTVQDRIKQCEDALNKQNINDDKKAELQMQIDNDRKTLKDYENNKDYHIKQIQMNLNTNKSAEEKAAKNFGKSNKTAFGGQDKANETVRNKIKSLLQGSKQADYNGIKSIVRRSGGN